MTTEKKLSSLTFRASFMMPNVFTGYDIGCKLKVCTLKIAWNVNLTNGSLELCKERMPVVGLVGLASRALITLRWRYKWRHRRLNDVQMWLT